jgi:hypothetical protein
MIRKDIIDKVLLHKGVSDPLMPEGFWFPGRWLGGFSLVLAPLLLLMGVLLRLPYHFFFPQQLAAFQAHPTRMVAAYSLFLAGNLLLWPGVATLAYLIGLQRPPWATWGGSMVLLGLFARTFHAGVDHLAFQLVLVQDLQQATQAVADAYGAFHIVSALNGLILLGWVVLAIGAYLSGTLGLVRSIALGLMAGLMMGVLKGSSAVSVVATSGLCLAFLPLGWQVLRRPPIPSGWAILARFLLIVILGILLYLWGQLG